MMNLSSLMASFIILYLDIFPPSHALVVNDKVHKRYDKLRFPLLLSPPLPPPLLSSSSLSPPFSS
jgi:hypothetical protein